MSRSAVISTRVALAALTTLVAAPPAAAHDHEPPRTVLEAGGEPDLARGRSRWITAGRTARPAVHAPAQALPR